MKDTMYVEMRLYRQVDIDEPIPAKLIMPRGVVGILYVYESVADAIAECGTGVQLEAIRTENLESTK